jgi:hypothetical protein
MLTLTHSIDTYESVDDDTGCAMSISPLDLENGMYICRANKLERTKQQRFTCTWQLTSALVWVMANAMKHD